jgi:RNA polymerase sigma-70 factor (ECF subfamily)
MGQDPATLDDLLAHGEWMRGLARRLLGDRDEADDVVQETWLSALRVPPTRDRTLRPWIATVMLNLVRSRARRQARTRAREALVGSADPAPAAEELLARRQSERLLAQLVLELDEPYRATILRRFHDGQSSAEIARAEGIPEGTVRWRLKYGLDQLRRRFGEDDRGARALGALVPFAGPPAAPAASWLGATLQGKAILMAVGAVATVAVVAAGVRQPARPVGSAAVASRKVAKAPAGKAPTWSALPPAPAAPVDGSGLFQPDPAAAPAPGVPPSLTLTAITGVVRNSRGDTAARVPVTLKAVAGSGVADRTTTTDDSGRFSYHLKSHGNFMLTAELQGEPAARLEIAVPRKRAPGGEAGTVLTSQAPSSASIDVAMESPPRRRATPNPPPRAAPGGLPSRWCCREAYEVGKVVYGRACLKFDDGHRTQQSGCDLYRLETQVFCRKRIHGGLSTGDLSRTDRLDCDGDVLRADGHQEYPTLSVGMK